MTERQTGKKIESTARAGSFAEISSVLMPHQAAAESARCLFCSDAPCVRNCPAAVDAVSFIRKIKTRNMTGAARVIRESNPFGGSCSRVCPQSELCEKGCNSSSVGTPVAIGELQRFVCDSEKTLSYRPPAAGPEKVLVIGAGPAGLSCAFRLRMNGVRVRILEKSDGAGGGLAFSIPDYRLPKDVVRREVNAILSMDGIELVSGSAAGPAGRYSQEYRAVFVATGLVKPPVLPSFPGLDIISAEELLELSIRENESGASGLKTRFGSKKVAVIGGGNSAMDAASTLVRLGAFVTVVYRRTEAEMPAWKKEYEEAKEDGAGFIFLAAPVGSSGRKLLLRKNALGAPGPDGRSLPVEIAGSDFGLEADSVVYAVGRKADRSILGTSADCAPVPGNCAVCRVPGTNIFAGGDLVNGGDTVVSAVGAGMAGAALILDLLKPESQSPAGGI